jgi:hypothetical protein
MDTLISQIEEKILYILDFNQKTLDELTDTQSQNHDLKTQIEQLQIEKLSIEEKLAELLQTLEQSENTLQQKTETYKELHEII